MLFVLNRLKIPFNRSDRAPVNPTPDVACAVGSPIPMVFCWFDGPTDPVYPRKFSYLGHPEV